MYKTIIIPVKCSKSDYIYLQSLNRYSADVWNYCVEIDKEYKEQTGKYMDMKTIQRATKGCSPVLHAKGVYFVYRKYMAARDSMFRSIKAKHENSSKVNLPYKKKKFYNTGWDYQSIKIDKDKGIIKLSRKKVSGVTKPNPIICYAKTIPNNIVEIELVYRKGLKLAIKYKEDDFLPLDGDGVSAIDLGEIHSITSIDKNGNAIIITGRKLRSINRLQHKEQAKLRSKRDKLHKNSRKYKKYSRAIYNLSYKSDKQKLDCVHKISKLYLDYCIKNGIKKVYYGDLDSCTRNSSEKINKFVGQKLNDWSYGLLMLQLHNKLERYGIELIKVSEAYSSQTCPMCGNKHKPTGRNYKCKCGYTQHRDIVGAMNILNFNEGTKISKYETMKYLRIA